MDSTLIVSNFDSLYGVNSRVINFPDNGAGLLTHLTINRAVYYLTQQYKDIKQNFISYFSSTKFDGYASLDQFFKGNSHSHFTSGISEALVFQRLTSSKNFQIVVYNVKEADSLDFGYLDEFVAVCEKYGLEVDIQFKGEQSFFNQFTGTTIVFEDEYDGSPFSIEDFQAKIWALEEFLVGKVFDVKSRVS